MRRLYTIFLILTLITSIDVFSQQSGGGYAASWTSRDFSARTSGMAGVFVAIADDPNAIYYNPAGLSNLPDVPTIISSVGMLGLGRTNSTFAWGQEVFPGLGVGIAFNNLFTGTFAARDNTGKQYNDYSNFQYAISASASYKIAYASFGATVKYLTDNLEGSETFANGYTVDFGALFDVFDLFKFGVQLQNASGFMFWNTTYSDIFNLPWKIRAGVSKTMYTSIEYSEDRNTVTGAYTTDGAEYGNMLTLGLDFAYSQYSVAPTVSIAAEYQAHRYLVFRGGIGIYGDNYGKPQILPMNSWGGGVSIYPEFDFFEDLPFAFSIDYTISNELTNIYSNINHALAFTINF